MATVPSTNREVVYTTTDCAETLCAICREEVTTIRDETSDIAICVYCAFARREGFEPSEDIS